MTIRSVTLPPTRSAAFETLHNQRLLGEHETVSGGGSKLMETRNLRRGLQELVDRGFFKSMLDAGCGDFHWMSMLDLKDVHYTGVDIVPGLIAENQRRWPRHDFQVADIVDGVPSGYELVLCKDIFTHLPHHDVGLAFNHIKRSGARYFAATNYCLPRIKPAQQEYHARYLNKNTGAGYWRAVALQEKPFYFPIPLFSIPANQKGKSLDIWGLEDLPFIQDSNLSYPSSHNPVRAEDFRQYAFFNALCALPFVKTISLYGSRARCDHDTDSDIDLMLYCDPLPTRSQWLAVCDIIERADTPLEIDCKLFAESLHSVMDNMPQVESNLTPLYERGV